ncbi:MAG: hypothetical protein QM757_15305 [Paludibaculum sp.]
MFVSTMTVPGASSVTSRTLVRLNFCGDLLLALLLHDERDSEVVWLPGRAGEGVRRRHRKDRRGGDGRRQQIERISACVVPLNP